MLSKALLDASKAIAEEFAQSRVVLLHAHIEAQAKLIQEIGQALIASRAFWHDKAATAKDFQDWAASIKGPEAHFWQWKEERDAEQGTT